MTSRQYHTCPSWCLGIEPKGWVPRYPGDRGRLLDAGVHLGFLHDQWHFHHRWLHPGGWHADAWNICFLGINFDSHKSSYTGWYKATCRDHFSRLFARGFQLPTAAKQPSQKTQLPIWLDPMDPCSSDLGRSMLGSPWVHPEVHPARHLLCCWQTFRPPWRCWWRRLAQGWWQAERIMAYK